MNDNQMQQVPTPSLPEYTPPPPRGPDSPPEPVTDPIENPVPIGDPDVVDPTPSPDAPMTA